LPSHALSGNYPGLNDLGLGDEFGRISRTPGVRVRAILRKPERIHMLVTSEDLTTGKARLKYREIPANRFLRVFDEGIVSDL
jgi:hypothetical protein